MSTVTDREISHCRLVGRRWEARPPKREPIIGSAEAEWAGLLANGSLDLHFVDQGDRHFALDVQSSTVLAVDALARAVLGRASDPGCAGPEVVLPPGAQFVAAPGRPETSVPIPDVPRDGFVEVLSELRALRERGLLHARQAARPALQLVPAHVSQVAVTTLIVSLIRNCNLACSYCYDRHRHTPSAPMRPEIRMASVDFLMSASLDHRNVSLDFTGGEPFLAFDAMKSLVDYAVRAGTETGKRVHFTTTTNATLIDDEKLDFLREHDFTASVSIDGPKPLHDRHRITHDRAGTHDLVVENALRIQGVLGDRMTARATVMPDELHRIGEIIEYLHGLGFVRLSVSPARLPRNKDDVPAEELLALRSMMADSLRSAEAIEGHIETFSILFGVQRLLAEGGKKCFGCPVGAGVKTLSVDTNGDVYPCFREFGNPALSMGNVLDGVDGLRLRTEMANSHVYARPCRTCWARHLCGGGCPMDSVDYRGSFHEPVEGICQMLRAGVEAHILAFADKEDDHLVCI